VAVLVDSVVGVVDHAADDAIATDAVMSGGGLVAGVLQLPDGLVLIHDLARFLSIDEQRQLEEALHHA
jgi:purine-binding chemotaxis protein CheW